MCHCSSRGVESFLIIVVVALLPVLAELDSSAFAQELELDASLEPPIIEQPSYLSTVRATLEEEITHFADVERRANETQKIVVRASLNLRIIAAELLSRADEAGGAGSVAALFGLRLADNRGAIDDVLVELHRELDRKLTLGDGDPADELAALESIERFNELALVEAESVRTVDPARLDAALARIFAPLAEVVASALELPIIPHWPDRAAVVPDSDTDAGAASPGESKAQLVAEIESLRTRIEASALSEPARSAMAETLAIVERGFGFADLRAESEALFGRLVHLVEFVELVQSADWLRPQQVEILTHQADAAILTFHSEGIRDHGNVLLERIEVMLDLLRRLDTLRDVHGPLRPVVDAIVEADPPGLDDASLEASLDALQRIGKIVDRMIAVRQIDRDTVPRQFRATMGRLNRAYNTAERALLRHLDRLTRDPDALTDPAVTSLLADQIQYLEDMQRMTSIDRWIETIAHVDPRSRNAFRVQLERMSRWLIDPGRRSEAVRSMDRLADELRMFIPMPFEDALEAGDTAAIRATGGMHEELLQRIRAARTEWAQAWALGEQGGEATDRLRLLHRLMLTIDKSHQLLGLDKDARRLNRWAAIEMPRGLFTRSMSDLPNRLKLATASAIENDDDALAAQLERIDLEAPLARLVGRLIIALDQSLADLPDGARGALGQIVHPPSDDAWLIERREALADLCRYALEMDHAWSDDREDQAHALQTFVDRLTDELLAYIETDSPSTTAGADVMQSTQ